MYVASLAGTFVLQNEGISAAGRGNALICMATSKLISKIPIYCTAA
jgi:hypothetical protein